MSSGKFPKPYLNEVVKNESLLVYVATDKMDIGARKSAMPKTASEGPKSLEHTGGSAGGKK